MLTPDGLSPLIDNRALVSALIELTGGDTFDVAGLDHDDARQYAVEIVDWAMQRNAGLIHVPASDGEAVRALFADLIESITVGLAVAVRAGRTNEIHCQSNSN